MDTDGDCGFVKSGFVKGGFLKSGIAHRDMATGVHGSGTMLTRRQWGVSMLALGLGMASTSRALVPGVDTVDTPWSGQSPWSPQTMTTLLQLTSAQQQAVRQWIPLIVSQQLNHGPNPRWLQHDCAGLVRFACMESLRAHDAAWLRANGLWGVRLPPEPELTPDQQQHLGQLWRQADGKHSAYIGAFELVQYNCRLIGRDLVNARPADVLLFDQGQAQHLMIWMGQYVAYHTGTVTPTDNGLRAYRLNQLLNWKDTRWQPHAQNPNFLGLFRLNFLTA